MINNQQTPLPIISYKELCKTLHTKYLSILNIYRFIQQEAFDRAYTIANPVEKKDVSGVIDSQNQTALTAWTKNILKKYDEYYFLDVRSLREIAQQKGVTNYSILNKEELVITLLNYKRKKEELNVIATN